MRNYLQQLFAVAAFAAATAPASGQTATALKAPERADLLYDFDGDGRWEIVKKVTFYEKGDEAMGVRYISGSFYMAQNWDDGTFRMVDGTCYARIPEGSGLEADLTLDGEALVQVDTQETLESVTRGRACAYALTNGQVYVNWGHDTAHDDRLSLLVLTDLEGRFLRPLAKVDWDSYTDYTATEFNGDGRMDLVTKMGERGFLLAQTAEGDFVTVSAFPAGRLPLRFDANGDGRPDFYVYSDGHKLLLQQADGSWTYGELPVTTDSTVIAGGTAPLSNAFSSPWQDQTIWGGAALPDANYGTAKAFDNLTLATDVNGDGYEDLMDTEAGGVMLSVGDGLPRVQPGDGGSERASLLAGRLRGAHPAHKRAHHRRQLPGPGRRRHARRAPHARRAGHSRLFLPCIPHQRRHGLVPYNREILHGKILVHGLPLAGRRMGHYSQALGPILRNRTAYHLGQFL